MPRPAAPGCGGIRLRIERMEWQACSLFAPLDGWRRVEVRERRTGGLGACDKETGHEDYPDRDRIVLVMDNLNTHKLSSLYEAFEPAEARRIAERLEIHYTPKHGSWVNMAEIGSVCWLDSAWTDGLPIKTSCAARSMPWQNQRNRDVIRVWRFTTEDARAKVTGPCNTKTLNH